MAQDCLDCMAAGLGAGVLEALWGAEFSLFLRSREFFDCDSPLDGEPADFLVASGGATCLSDILRARPSRRVALGATCNRRHRIHVRSGNSGLGASARAVSPGGSTTVALGSAAVGV